MSKNTDETEVYWRNGYMQPTIPYWVRFLRVLCEGEVVFKSLGEYDEPGLDVWG